VRGGRVGWKAGRVDKETLGPGTKVGEDVVEEGKERERETEAVGRAWLGGEAFRGRIGATGRTPTSKASNTS
jgi:hypothetical protein